MYRGCQISEQLRRYLIANLYPKDHKEDPSTDGRITTQDICQMKIKNWMACVQDRWKWKEFVE